MKAEMLEREFTPRRAAQVDGAPLFDAAVTGALIDRATEEGVPIVRLAGVRLGADGAGNAERPPEHACDFSARVAEGHGCWAEAETFVQERHDAGLLFEVALGSDPINAA